MSLKYGLTKYSACISFIATGKYVPFSPFVCILLNILLISVCFGKKLCARFPILTRLSNSQGSWKNDLLDLCYVSEITPP